MKYLVINILVCLEWLIFMRKNKFKIEDYFFFKYGWNKG